jgi:dihydropteroate synthase
MLILGTRPRAQWWQLRTQTLQFGKVPAIMGIVNVTPDSFSDGGNFLDMPAAVEHAMQLADAGAAVLDIGGESTRPYAESVTETEELRRVIPVIEKLVSQTDVPISIDTSKAKVAAEAVATGAEIINDVTGLEGDPNMLGVAVETAAGVCAMHMQGTPQTMQNDPHYDDVVQDIYNYLEQRKTALLAAGIELSRICLDPGVGFGKTHQHNLDLVAGCASFHSLGCPLLVGHSRKGFIAKILGRKDADRTAGTIGVAVQLALAGVQVIRVHDVQPVADALKLFAAVGGIDGKTQKLE